MNANAERTNPPARMNGAQPQGQQLQISPVEAARLALMFLTRTTMQPAERQQYDIAESLLGAIVRGEVVLANPQAAEGAPADAPGASEAPPVTPH